MHTDLMAARSLRPPPSSPVALLHCKTPRLFQRRTIPRYSRLANPYLRTAFNWTVVAEHDAGAFARATENFPS